MIILKLDRDQARSVEIYFFDYLDHYCNTRKNDAKGTEEKFFQAVILDIYYQVKVIFKKRLAGQAIKINIKLTDSQGIILHKLLLALPLDPANIWLIMLRQLICNIIYSEVEKLIF